MKLFVCGSRSITDKEWIFSKIEECIKENNFSDITILEGEAAGVDLIAKEWATAHNVPVKEYPPDVKHYLHNACHQRNEAMAKDCDFMLDLWTGESGGSLHDIIMAEKYQKPYKVCLYGKDSLFMDSVYYVLQHNKELFRFSENLKEVFPKFREAVDLASKKNTDMNPEVDVMENKEIDERQEWKWCLVGNIVQEREYGENHEIKCGTKHFSPGTKIYCAQGRWGDGYENIIVIGKHRGCNKYIRIIMPRKYIENFRCQKVYKPSILKLMENDFWDNSDSSRDTILKMAEGLNSLKWDN